MSLDKLGELGKRDIILKCPDRIGGLKLAEIKENQRVYQWATLIVAIISAGGLWYSELLTPAQNQASSIEVSGSGNGIVVGDGNNVKNTISITD